MNAMACKAMLSRFPVLRTRDVDELQDWFGPLYAVKRWVLPHGKRTCNAIVNHCELPSLGLTFANYGIPIQGQVAEFDYFLHGFSTAGSGQLELNHGVQTFDAVGGSIVAGPSSATARFDFDASLSHLNLRVASNALLNKLAALTGMPSDRPLQLTGHIDPIRAARQKRLMMFLAEELELAQEQTLDPVTAELQDAILVNFLLGNAHNLSHLLSGKPRAAAPWQVRRAVDYMEQHWDEPITIDKLTEVTETSARSLFLLFKKTHDVSPMVYLSKIRLQKARDMLSRPDSDTSVTKVGFMCGFSNLGNFAMKYHAAFGERPSQTLRNHLE